MRIGEINALHINDINFKDKTISVNKTISRDNNYKDYINNKPKTKSSIRKVPINIFLYTPLKKFCKGKTGLLFSDERIISTSSINSEFKRLNKKYKFKKGDVNTHMLRHTFATRCIEAGMQPIVLKKLLGHSKISTTLDTYSHVFIELENKQIDVFENYMKKIK